MVIGFLGKGGSGKSTLATSFAKYLAETGASVLAVDADHNMDMSFNFNAPEMNYIGQGMEDILVELNVQSYRDAFTQSRDPEFSLSPLDPITEKYSVEVAPNIRLMSAGPHTMNILNENTCAHSLVEPLKVYLPFLKLKENEYAVVDEKAGADGVGTGVTSGFSVAVVVTEPTVYGLKATKQIADMLEFYKTPYVYALNKVEGKEDEDLFFNTLTNFPDLIFPFDKTLSRMNDRITEEYKTQFATLVERLKMINDTRVQRSKEKVTRNTESI